MSIITDVDSYKVGMWKQYPPKTEFVSSYIESRGSDDKDYNESVFFGLQYWIKEYLMKPITEDDILEAKELFKAHGEPFNAEGWYYILNRYNGFLPLKIEAVPEGAVISLSNVLVQVSNTDPACYWLTTWIETSLLRTIWYATSVATTSYTIKKLMKKYYNKSGSVDGLDFKLHDFGSRGVSSKESAGIGGLAHLISFRGTDTIEALLYGRKYYNEWMPGFSIPAMEHSTVTTWGKENETLAFKNMLNVNRTFPVVACVSDSYDIYNAVDNIWGGALKARVEEGKQVVVIRPDSGDPLTVPIVVINKLMDKFGYTTNDKGYKTLPSYIRVIQGDGITKDSIKTILDNMDRNKLSLDNLAFGMGGGLLQHTNRDILKFAMKASSITVDGKNRDVWKDPVEGGKQSKRGVLGLYHDGYKYITKKANDVDRSYLEEVYVNGNMLMDDSLENIRNRAAC